MAYFLKKSNFKKGIYLQIYESFYNAEKKDTAHRSHKALGYVDALISSGIDDPVSYYKNVVAQMNAEAKAKKETHKDYKKQISDTSPEKHLGCFLIKAVFDGLGVSGFFDFLQIQREFRFRISDIIESLVYSRMVEPCSKRKTFSEVIPSLFGKYDFSYDQLLDGVEFIGSEYEKVIEIFNHQLNLKYPSDTSLTYFDGTNFYFEIDQEDDIRRKGPSKENRKDPIIGMGLLLDRNQIPLGMKLYPGNQSEMPVIREVIADLKNRNNITGRTVQVADKGLNCAKNILDARKNGDGYIFSKSVKKLPATEKTWVLSPNGFKDVFDENKKLLHRIKECVDKFPYVYEDENGKKTTVMLTEKRVVVFNPQLAKKKKIEINRMVEKAKALKASRAKKEEFGESAKYVTFTTTDKKGNATDGRVAVSLNTDAIQEDLKLAGYNLFVTSETKMDAEDIRGTYQNLWRIEESFKVMKSYLDARPVYLQKENSIYGHFLICYISVLLLRVLQFHIFENKYGTENILSFIEKFRVVEIAHGKYINLATSSPLIKSLSRDFSLPLLNYHLSQSQINKVLNLTL
jgi:transposase